MARAALSLHRPDEWPEALSVSQVAELLAIGRAAVIAAIERGELSAVAIGGQYRIAAESVWRLVPARSTPTGPKADGERRTRHRSRGPIGLAAAASPVYKSAGETYLPVGRGAGGAEPPRPSSIPILIDGVLIWSGGTGRGAIKADSTGGPRAKRSSARPSERRVR